MTRRWRRPLLAFTSLTALLILFAHPWFAITRPVGGGVLVAEGWMHRDGLLQARRIFLAGGYDRLYLTGTLRPFTYQLHGGESFTIRTSRDLREEIRFKTTGLPGAQWAILGDGDTLLTGAVTTRLVRHRATLPHAVREIRFVETSGGGPPGSAVVFVGSMTGDGDGMHALVDTMVLHHADGGTEPGWPTHAEHARAILLRAGMPDSLLRAVPIRAHRARTRASARAFASLARAEGITRLDVATLSVHARRTHHAFVKALGPACETGVIALEDHRCPRWSWWTRPYGWLQVMKEVVAAPFMLIPAEEG